METTLLSTKAVYIDTCTGYEPSSGMLSNIVASSRT